MAETLDASVHEAAAAICLELGVKPIAVNGGLLKAWIHCEKGNAAGAGWVSNNPLNTTQSEYPDWNVNSADVKGYESQQEGVYAVCQTLRNGLYPHLLAGLQDANAETFFSNPDELDKWGTGYTAVYAAYQMILAGTLV